VAHPQIAVFARLANGTAKPVRAISGQDSLLGRTTHELAYNAVRDEIVIPQVFGQSILTFAGDANGKAKPLRVIQGPLTQLRGASMLGIDAVNNEIFVPEGSQIQVFDLLANGNVAPKRILKGPDTMLGAANVSIDPIHNRMIVVGSVGTREKAENNQILIFDRLAEGNTKPLAVIKGPKSGIDGTFGLRVYPPTGMIAVSVNGPQHTDPNDASYVGIWSINDNGDVPPRYKIGGPYGILKQPRGVDFDPKNKAILVSDKLLNSVLTFSLPEIY